MFSDACEVVVPVSIPIVVPNLVFVYRHTVEREEEECSAVSCTVIRVAYGLSLSHTVSQLLLHLTQAQSIHGVSVVYPN